MIFFLIVLSSYTLLALLSKSGTLLHSMVYLRRFENRFDKYFKSCAGLVFLNYVQVDLLEVVNTF